MHCTALPCLALPCLALPAIDLTPQQTFERKRKRNYNIACQPTSLIANWRRDEFKGRTGQVTAAGHSLGAGVASLAASWAALQWPAADVRCVTFGNPKPGNAAYARVCPTPFSVKLLFCVISCSDVACLTEGRCPICCKLVTLVATFALACFVKGPPGSIPLRIVST